MLAQHYAFFFPSTGVEVGGEPIKHLVRQCFPFWCLMVNTSGGVGRFYWSSRGSRVAEMVCYRSLIYSYNSVENKFSYTALSISYTEGVTPVIL